MFEGQNVLFQGDDFVPNVLFHETRNGPPDFLLAHRILTLIAEGASFKTYDLIACLEGTGVARVDVITCIDRLQRALLLRCSDAEVVDMSRALPHELLLTPAGSEYLQHLFRLGDFLLTVIVDVPLRHDELRERLARGLAVPGAKRGKVAYFDDRLSSLLEYVEEVRKQEERQLRLLTRIAITKPIARVVDALRRGGLFTRALLDGIEDVVGRNRSSTLHNVRLAIKRAEQRIAKLRGWLASAETRLGEILNRSGRFSAPVSDPVVLTDGSVELTLVGFATGDEACVRVDVRAPISRNPIILIVRAESNGASFIDGTLPFRKARSSQEATARVGASATLRGTIPLLPRGGTLGDYGGQALELGPVPTGRRRGVLFVIEDHSGGVQLRLAIENDEASYDLGPRFDGPAIRNVSRLCLDQVGEALCTNGDASDQIGASGEKLRRLIMSPNGRSLFFSYLGMIDILVVAAQQANLIVPWEWLCTLPDVEQRVEFIRWPVDPAPNIFKFSQLTGPREACSTLLTFGLKTDRTWRRAVPARYSELAKVATAQVSHFVAHAPSSHILIGGLRVDEDVVAAYQLRGNRHVVLSSCEAGARDANRNLAVALAESSKAIVWTPMVRITEEQAAAVDEGLERYLSSDTTGRVEDFMLGYSGLAPILQIYVQYRIGSR